MVGPYWQYEGHESMSFERYREAIRMICIRRKGAADSVTPRLIIPMSLQPAIPRRGALQQSSSPLHRPLRFCTNAALLPTEDVGWRKVHGTTTGPATVLISGLQPSPYTNPFSVQRMG